MRKALVIDLHLIQHRQYEILLKRGFNFTFDRYAGWVLWLPGALEEQQKLESKIGIGVWIP